MKPQRGRSALSRFGFEHPCRGDAFFCILAETKKGAGISHRTPYKHNTMQNYKEIWKDIPNYEGMYQVSNLGRIKSLKFGKEKIIKLDLDSKGYLRVRLSNNNISERKKVHRLVMLVFMGSSDLQVNHKNGIKSDNRLENLEYCTASENVRHAFKIGLNKNAGRNPYKLTEADAKRIKHKLNHLTQAEVANIYNVSQMLISKIRSGKAWRHI